MVKTPRVFEISGRGGCFQKQSRCFLTRQLCRCFLVCLKTWRPNPSGAPKGSVQALSPLPTSLSLISEDSGVCLKWSSRASWGRLPGGPLEPPQRGQWHSFLTPFPPRQPSLLTLRKGTEHKALIGGADIVMPAFAAFPVSAGSAPRPCLRALPPHSHD